ncbi:MAG: tetratricopeptide repeat protein, partial [Candidatus Eisenbacteria bacterium]|nr:tetratricopeptide repeat protein [Candidatus Eisenbacteria bacterium]
VLALVLGIALRSFVLRGAPMNDGATGSVVQAILRSGALFLLYVSRVLVPWRPRMEAPGWVEEPNGLVGIMGLLLLLSLLVFTAWIWWSSRDGRSPRKTGILVGLGLILAGILPVLQWFPIGELYGERFLYLPLVGLAIALGSWAIDVPMRRARQLRIVAVLIVPWCAITLLRLPDWKDEISLFAAAVRDSPNNPRALANYGSALFLSGRNAEAEAPLERAAALDPEDLQTQAQLGALLVNLGRAEEGLPHLEAAASKGSHDRGLLYNLGVAKLRAGDLEGARQTLEAVVAEHPDDAASLESLASVARKQGDFERAATLFERTRQTDPGRKSAVLNLIGVLYYDLQRPDRARPVIEDFLRRFPGAPEADAVRQLLNSLEP